MLKVNFEKVYVNHMRNNGVHMLILQGKVTYKFQTMLFSITRVITMALAHSNGCDNNYLIPSKNSNEISNVLAKAKAI